MKKVEITVDQRNKIYKSFCVVGLNPAQLHYYIDPDKPNQYIQKIDILVKKLSTTSNIYIPEDKDEKWLRVMRDCDTWFRVKYTSKYNNPITDFKVIGCKYDETGNYLLIDNKHIRDKYFPIRITNLKEKEKEGNNNSDEKNITSILDELEFMGIKNYKKNDKFAQIPKDFNLKEIMNLPVKNNAGVILVTRENNTLPLRIIQIEHLKDQNYQFKKGKNKSPYIYSYTPEVIDQYPQSDSFNNSVAMFCFPEGIKISEKEIEPTKFNFVLTDEIGERTYGSCLIFWEKLKDNLRLVFEPIYNEFVKKTKEEIELEIKENEKSGELTKEINPEKLKEYYAPKALCILSKFPFFSNSILFLKEVYRIFTSSSSLIPLERAICSYVDSLYKQSYNQLIRFSIRKEFLDFYFIPKYGKDWDINDQYLETLFRVLSVDIITTAWQGLLLEKKLFLICSSKETLLQVAHSFVTLLFPFKWIHTYIPILPEKLKAFTESPMPLIFGIPFKIDLNDLPDDGIIININKNCLENYREEIPKLTGKLKVFLDKKLAKLMEKYKIDKPVDSDKWMDYLDNVNTKEIPENANKIDCGDIRDVFYEVFIQMFKNYQKYINLDKDKMKKDQQENNDENEEEEEQQIEFKREVFLKDHGSTDEGSFLSMFCDTALFSQFISSIPIINQNDSTTYFFECVKGGKGKNQVYLPNIMPKEIIMANPIKIDDLNGEEFFYNSFPKLNPKLYIQSEVPKKIYKSKFIFQKDEWCYEPSKLKKKEWPKYLLYLIYEIWYNFFSFSIHFYDKDKSKKLMEYALSLLEDLINQKKITPTRNLFSKIFKACGKSDLSSFTKNVLELANNVYKKSSSTLFQSEYLNGLYALTGKANSAISMSLTNSIFNAISARQSIMEDINTNTNNFEYFDSFIFLTVKYCPYCTKNVNNIKYISMEELLAGFKDIKKEDSVCPHCLTVITTNIYYLNKNDKKLEIKKFKLLSPYKIVKEIDDINKNYGEVYFYLNNKNDNYKMEDLYKSIIFYFKLFDLPLFVLCIENDPQEFQENIAKEIEANILRKKPIKKKGNKEGISPDKHNKKKDGVSPDRKSTQLDTSEDNRSISGYGNAYGDTSSFISGKTDKSVVALMERELWKDIFIKNMDKIKLTGDKIGTEDRSDLLTRIKFMKSVIGDIISHFVTSYKEELGEYLNENGFYNDIKEKESSNTMGNIELNDNQNPFIEKKIRKGRPQSYDRKKYEGFSSNDYYNRQGNNNMHNYNSDAFDAIIQDNRQDAGKSDRNIPSRFNQIDQLNDRNDGKSKGFFKNIFSFGKK